MHEVKEIHDFSFFKDKKQLSNGNRPIHVYQSENHYFLVCDVGYHASTLMQVEVNKEVAEQVLIKDNSGEIIEKYFRTYGIF